MAVRFADSIRVGASDECWPWLGTTDRNGYGVIKDDNGKQVSAHRVAYALTRGAIPSGRLIMHRCDNPPCCNPEHLHAGTNLENQRDKKSKGRGVYRRGASHHMTRLTDLDVANIRSLAGHVSRRAIAARYGVCRQTIDRIVNGIHWQHLD